MAYYNANEVVRLTRIAVGMTQEELSDGICSVVTLSRMECGHHAVKRKTYRKLMAKMGRITEKRYAVCVDKDGELSEEKIKYERAFNEYDYEEAGKYLEQMKANASDSLLTRQYLVREEALMSYYLNKISDEELIEELGRALRMTVPEYEKYVNSDKAFPFMNGELQLVMNIANAYNRLDEREKALLYYKKILQCLDANYMCDPDNTKIQVIVRMGLLKVLEGQGKYEEALEETEYCIQRTKQIDYGHVLAPLLTIKAFNMLQVAKKTGAEKTILSEIGKLLRQSYYVAVARGDEKVKQIIVDYSKKQGLEIVD